jgi:hypothetical protein
MFPEMLFIMNTFYHILQIPLPLPPLGTILPQILAPQVTHLFILHLPFLPPSLTLNLPMMNHHLLHHLLLSDTPLEYQILHPICKTMSAVMSLLICLSSIPFLSQFLITVCLHLNVSLLCQLTLNLNQLHMMKQASTFVGSRPCKLN